MKRNRSWPVLLSLALTLHWFHEGHCIMQPMGQHAGVNQHRPRPYFGVGSLDARIDSYMRSHNLRYPQHSNNHLINRIPVNIEDYGPHGLPQSPQLYDYEDSNPNLQKLVLNHPHLLPNQGEKLHHQSPQSMNVHPPHSKPVQPLQSMNVEQHIKQSPHKVTEDKVKVESRSSVSQAGTNQISAVVPGLSESVREGEESVRLTDNSSIADVYLLAVIAGCAVAAVSGLALTGLCWYRMHKRVKATSDVEYPAYGVTGPAKEKSGPPGDRKLAQSAQMYHYQHQKQQMIASERLEGGGNGSDGESEEECEEGDYTVFECPGLATAGEMEVRNPLFNDQTPVATPAEK